MTATWKTVRVFISSTFRDMQAERDHLVRFVFPKLRQELLLRRIRLADVDLRWGVPEKNADGEKANSWEYCRQWIDRVEPFFVCILGQRYGWVPEPEQLKAREDRQRQQGEKRSIADMEVRHAALNTKLKRRSYFYLRATEAPATVSEYVDPPPLLSKLAQLKTEVRSCGRPVRDYLCEWTGSDFVGMEEFGRRVLDDLWFGVLREGGGRALNKPGGQSMAPSLVLLVTSRGICQCENGASPPSMECADSKINCLNRHNFAKFEAVVRKIEHHIYGDAK
jgi:hypothetical protein